MTNRTDTFNRADGALGTPSDGGSAWVDVGPKYNILTNAVGNVIGGTPDVAFLECSAADGTVQVSLPTKNGSSYAGLVVRGADSSNYIVLRANPSNYELISFIAGAETSRGTGGSTPANGDVLSIVASGTSITGKVNGSTVVGPVTISSLSSNTKCGLYTYSDGVTRFDDFSWTDAGGGGGSAVGAAAHYYRQMS